ncbi:DUF6527 family protein [Agrobacterium leguminum]|uniref:DUF6527 family protein n=1 Tax=Agrobacterium leguminum TaxID=2792015 RepID=A0A9X3KC90_9HYPH|nr:MULTISPECIES: DUF6527 family protein [Agrobacterium]MCZ7909404.1 DUF6527 family protein [Agrobacterium leguminum]WFS67924.1 DUF6527 family protein [Agrobacterium leguminum]
MAALSSKLRSAQDGGILFWCPGCDGAHQVGVGEGAGPRWEYNGNPDAPTFTPSILVRGTRPLSDEEIETVMTGQSFSPVPTVCHSFVTDGQIHFLNDCTHSLAGRTVDIPDFDN